MVVEETVNQEGFVILLLGFLGFFFLRKSLRTCIPKREPVLINSSSEVTEETLPLEISGNTQRQGDGSDTEDISKSPQPSSSIDAQEILTSLDEKLSSVEDATDAEPSDNQVLAEASLDVPAQAPPEALIASTSFRAEGDSSQELSDEDLLRVVGDRKFKLRSFHIPKDGFSEAECEDKIAINPEDSASLRLAVSDGATEGIFSNIWAELLVNSYTENGFQILEPSNLKPIHSNFIQKAFQIIANMPETRHWFMYEKLERGTHATLAAVEFFDETIQILTVGDSCVFWHDGEKIGRLPEISLEDFGSFPNTICHLPKTWQSLEQKVVKKEIQFHNPFQLALCTDALACWLVKGLRDQNEFSVWGKIFQISDSSSFKQFIEELRESKEIRNDDVSLVLIDVLPVNV